MAKTKKTTATIHPTPSASGGLMSTGQVARLLGVDPSTIQKRAARMVGVAYIGGRYLLTAAQMELIADALRDSSKRGPKATAAEPENASA